MIFSTRGARGRLCVALFFALAAAGCQNCGNPLSPESAANAARDVWVSPNIGSRDFLDLFSNPDAWSNARTKVTTIGFSGSHVLDDPCAGCGPNTLRNFLSVVPGGAFRWLPAHHLKIALEAPSVKSFDCTATTTVAQALTGIGNIVANGGAVSYLAIDEPFFSGLPPNQSFAASVATCGYSVAQTADQVRTFIARVHASYPDVQVGLVEPYPYFSAAQIESFVNALIAAGVTLPFFHMDYDQNFLSVDPAPDFLELRNFFRQKQIAFGIIIIGNDGTNGQVASNGALVAALRISNVLGIHSMPHVLFESWLDYPPSRGLQDLRIYPDNLPENVQTTMMGMVNTVLDNMP